MPKDDTIKPSDGPIWDLPAHTSTKHQILRNYLGGWYAKLGQAKTHRRVIFLDGFAGPGIYIGGEEGSPVIALRTLLDHQWFDNITRDTEFVFLFNEQDQDRAAILRETLEELETTRGGWPKCIKVRVADQNFDTLTDELLAHLEDRIAALAPTFAFVDPFGYRDVKMDKLRRLLAYPSCELFIYFDFNSVQRFATAGNVDQHFEALFGTDEFKNAPATKEGGRAQFLLELYERQLREVAGFPYVQAFAMVNKQGRTGNCMIFCSRNLAGLDLMKKAMWSVDPTGEYRFYDRFAGYDILVGLEVAEIDSLKTALMTEFSGKTVTIEQIEEYVLTRTPFHTSHIRRATLSPLQRAGLITTDQVRRGSFKAGCRITFS